MSGVPPPAGGGRPLPPPSFDGARPPPGYEAGRGRGATGFVTTAQVALDSGSRFGPAPEGYVAGRGRGYGDTRREALEAEVKARLKKAKEEAGGEEDLGQDEDDRGLEEDDVGLFANAVYEDDDREADEIYAQVDAKMDSRRHKQREARIQRELEKYRRENPTLRQQFADIKRDLSSVSEDQWAMIPEIGNYSVKRQRQEKYTPTPDIVIGRAREKQSVANSVDPRGEVTDLASIGEGRGAVLGQKLDRASDSVAGQTNIDPGGYLTQMSGMNITSNSDIGDIKKARLLLKSVTTTNPLHGPGWIASARLEEHAHKMPIARKIIAQGCQLCPTDEDVWLEAARLHPSTQAKGVLASAVRRVPKSVKLWLQAASLEETVKNKRRVLRKALELIPNSGRLWRAAIDLEDPADARILLGRAVECVPQAVDLWLAYAKLSNYEEAKEVLNRARDAIPAEPSIWLTAAKLEEVNSSDENHLVQKIVERAVQALSISQQVIPRERWIQESKDAERSGHPAVCRALVTASLSIGVEKIDRMNVWKADADAAEHEGMQICARAFHEHLAKDFPAKEEIWLEYANFEKRAEGGQKLTEILKRAAGYCPRSEKIWIMASKEALRSGGVTACRTILSEAFNANPNSETIWLAAVKLETEAGELDRARILLQRTREQAESGRVYMKSALLERLAGAKDAEEKLLLEGTAKYPGFWKMWLMLAQLYERNEDFVNARATYNQGLSKSPKTSALYLGLSKLEERQGHIGKARAVLERGRQSSTKAPDIWLASVRFEKRRDAGAASSLMTRGLKECPQSGLLWAEAIEIESRPKQKSRSVDALKNCDKDARVMIAVARVFWRDRKIEKGRNWLERAVALNPDLGDAWAHLLLFEEAFGEAERAETVKSRCVKSSPSHGEAWCKVSKALGNESLSCVQILERASREIPPV